MGGAIVLMGRPSPARAGRGSQTPSIPQRTATIPRSRGARARNWAEAGELQDHPPLARGAEDVDECVVNLRGPSPARAGRGLADLQRSALGGCCSITAAG